MFLATHSNNISSIEVRLLGVLAGILLIIGAIGTYAVRRGHKFKDIFK